jgi:hypothetical protein
VLKSSRTMFSTLAKGAVCFINTVPGIDAHMLRPAQCEKAPDGKPICLYQYYAAADCERDSGSS